METVRTIGRFAYEASATPKGHRKPRLALLSAEAEFAVVCPSADEVAADAVVASPSGYPDAVTRVAPPAPEVRYAAWDGKLWLPIERDGEPVGIETGLAMLRQGEVPGFPRREIVGYDADIYAPPQDEREFEGRIEWDAKADAIRLQEEALRRVVSIGGVLHRRSEGPVWAVSRKGTLRHHEGLVRLHVPERGSTYMAEGFAADRLGEAMRRCESVWGRCRKLGEVRIKPGLLPARDDLAHAMNSGFGGFRDGIEALVALDPETLLAGRRICAAARGGRPFPNDGVADPASFLADARTVRAALSCRDGRLANRRTEARNKADSMLTAIAALEERVAFEAACGRAPGLPADPADEAALAAAGV